MLRERSALEHLVCFEPGTGPAREGQAGVASLLLRQRGRLVRKLRFSCWQLMFVGCLTRVHTDTSTCNSSTCPPVETRHPQMMVLLRTKKLRLLSSLDRVYYSIWVDK